MATTTNVDVIIRAIDNATKVIRDIGDEFSNTGKRAESSFASATSASNMFAGALLAITLAASGVIAKSTLTAARTETMGVAMYSIAKATNTSTKVLAEQEEILKKQGITTQEARRALMLFMQSELDVAAASKVARVAQDLAVIAGENSSQTTGKLTEAIVNQNVLMLRQFGIVKNSNDIFDAYGKTLNKSGKELTEMEKRQAFLNVILMEGKKVAGAYEAAMTTAGKKLTSLPRYFEEAANAIGEVFLPAFADLIDALTAFLKQVNPANIRKVFTVFMENLPLIAGIIIGGLIPAFIALGKAFWISVLPAIIALLPYIAIGGLIGLGIKALIDHFGTFGEMMVFLEGKTQPFVDAIEVGITRIKQILKGFGISGEFGGLIILFQTMGDKIPYYIERISQIVGEFVETIKNKLAGFGEGQTASWIDAFKGIHDRIKPVIEAVKATLEPLGEQFALMASIIETKIKPAWDAMMEAWKPFAAAVGPQIIQTLKGIAIFIGVAIGIILLLATTILVGLVTAVTNALPYILQAFEGLIQFFRGFFQLITGLIKGDWKLALEGLKQMAKGAYDFVVNIWTALQKFIKGFIKGVISFFQNLYDALIGKSIIPDIVEGVVGGFNAIKTKVTETVSKLVDGVKKFFDDMKTKIEGVIGSIKTLIDNFKPKISIGLDLPDVGKAWNDLKSKAHSIGVPGFQTGGIVPGPIGAPVPIFAHGGEKVTPVGLSGSGGGGGSGSTFNIYIGMYAGSQTEKRNIAKELYGALLQVAQSQNRSVSEFMGG